MTGPHEARVILMGLPKPDGCDRIEAIYRNAVARPEEPANVKENPMSQKKPTTKLSPVMSLEHMRYQLETGVSIADWDNESLEQIIREHIQLQEGLEEVLALPDHLMRRAAKEAAHRGLGR